MKIVYASIIIFVVLAAILLFYLLPTQEEESLIHLKTQDFSQAEPYYEKKWEAGDRSIHVIIPLVKIREGQGKMQEAIALLEEYVKGHPQDPQGLKMLSDLYLNGLYKEKYVQSLEKLVQLGDEKSLSTLAYWYQDHGELQKACPLLQKLVRTEEVVASNFYDLAKCYEEGKNLAGALSLMEMKRTRFPKEVSVSDLIYELKLLHTLKAGDTFEKAWIRLLADFLVQKNEPESAFGPLEYLRTYYPEHTDAFIAWTKPLANKDLDLKVASLDAERDNPAGRQKAFRALFQLYRNGFLNVRLANVLFSLFLDDGDLEALKQLLQKVPASQIDENSLVNYIVQASGENDEEALQLLRDNLYRSELQAHPVLYFALENKAPPSLQELTRPELFYLFKLAASKQKKDYALNIGANLPDYFGLQPYQLAELATLYTSLKEGKRFERMLSQSALERKTTEEAFLILEFTNSRPKKVIDWLKQKENPPDYLLQNLYTAAAATKEYSAALLIAKRLVKREQTFSNQMRYALALTQVGKIENGLALLQNLYAKHPQKAERTYFEALLVAYKHNTDYKEQLLAFMNSHQNPSKVLQRDFAYTYMDLGAYSKAEKALWAVAQKESGESDDVQTLIFLWGPNPTVEQAAWIEQRARSAGDDFPYWLKHLSFIGHFCSVIELYEKNCSLKKEALFAYMDALVALDKLSKLRCILRKAPYYPKEIIGYAEIAEDLELQRWLLRKLGNYSQLASVDFARGAYCCVAKDLKHLHCLKSEHFLELGTVWEFWRCYEKARSLWLWGLHINLNCTPEQTLTKALLLQKLNENRINGKEPSLNEMALYYERTAKDSSSKAAFANMMMDLGYIELAGDLLHCGH